METKSRHNWISKLLCVAGLGGLLTYYFAMVSKSPIEQVSKTIKDMAMRTQIELIKSHMLGFAILSISVFLLLLSPLLMKNEKRKWLKIYILIAIFLINGSSIVITVVQGTIPNLYIFILWISLSYILWLLFDVMKIIYNWVRADGQTDIVKLTFIWAILTFILAKIW